MHVTALFGTTVAELSKDELCCMVESGKTVRELKQLLSVQVGCSRFQQSLFNDDIGELQDDMPLIPLPFVQLVILPFDEIAEEELFRSCRFNHIIAIERLLQKPQRPNKEGLFVAAENGHLAVLQLLLEGGVDKDAANTRGERYFMIAPENGYLPGWLLILEAMWNGFLQDARLLFEAGSSHGCRKHNRKDSFDDCS